MMQIPQIRSSRWFISVSSGLLVFLCLAVLVAGLLLVSQSSQPRAGQVAGSSMEPTLQGPRLLVTCSACQAVNPFSIDAWNPKRPAYCPCCGRVIIADDGLPVQHGENIQYISTRWMRPRSSERGDGQVQHGRIQRGDIVVLQRESQSIKEVKRVVGLPNEKIFLREGDLWINDQRYAKSLRETLSQSVLVAAWDPRFCDRSLTEFLESLPYPPNNELPINAHDSHARIATYDVGIALRCSGPILQGRFVIRWSDSRQRYDIDVLTNEDWTVTCNNIAIPQLSAGQGRGGELSQWLILAMIDGRLLVGDERGMFCALPLESLHVPGDDDSPKPSTPSISVSSMENAPRIDLALMFRDLVYRGYGDTADETIPAGPGFVLLGDNVSISDDSRGPAGNSVRWGADRIKGVVLRDSNDLASLLRQSEALRSCGCGSQRLE